MKKLLIANRGEIACRIARTAHRMGIRTVAVFGEPDRNAPHVRQCNEAVDLSGHSAGQTYLDIGKLLGAAARTGADAVHPGYGFLAESPAFAQAVAEAGLTFVGPSADAMRRLGGKAEARQLAATQGIPVIPGEDGVAQDRLVDAGARIGVPLLVKASAGGGGRGMRVVRDLAALPDLLRSAADEALAAFGDGSLILERLVEPARHVEVQVFADAHGQVVHLGERDCTLQRRHQKVIEEAPAAFLPQQHRSALHDAAVKLIRTAEYTNAATVEFLIGPDGAWYLIEVNTRLQVEHPVTELLTGQDLVEWQLRIARGEPLPLEQCSIRFSGHAVELRICAEDPAHGLRPTTGRVGALRLPDGVRVDHGLAPGLVVGAEFDSLLAKLVVTADDRGSALRRARAALACLRVDGIVTNIPLLDRILAEPAFVTGQIDTNWLEPALAGLVAAREPSFEDMAIATIVRILERAPDRRDPWLATAAPWRLNLPPEEMVRVADLDMIVRHGDGIFHVRQGERVLDVRADWTDTPDLLAVEVEGHRRHLMVRREPDAVLFLDRQVRVTFAPSASAVTLDDEQPLLRAPLPGKVVALNAALGADVARGEVLVVLDAMKMEHRLMAPMAGRVVALSVLPGDRVVAGQLLVELAP